MDVRGFRHEVLPAAATGNVGRSSKPDAVSILTLFALLLYVVPSDRRVEALGGAGTPATLLALCSLLWWVWHHLNRPSNLLGSRVQLVRTAAIFFAAAVIASYARSAMMALPAVDRSVSDMGLLRVAALVGILLVANDGIPNSERFLTLVRRLATIGGLYALLGLVQFFTKQSLVDLIQIPGMVSSGGAGIDARAGFARAESTASHPLEYALVMTALLPFCLTLAIHDRSRGAVVRWFPVLAIMLSSVLSVTRSALIGLAVVFIMLFPSWPTRMKIGIGISMAAGAAVLYVAVPGMAGTIVGMFSGNDTSVSSRTDSYSSVVQFSQVSPIFGRGFGTFLPAYRILDNQYLGTIIELGFVGLVALAAIIVSASMAAIGGRRGHESEPMHAMGLALFASIVSTALLFAFFDAFSFPQACNTLFLIAGLCGAYWNLGRPTRSNGRELRP